MKIGIQAKILGIFLLLITVMIISAGMSAYRTNLVRREMVALTKCYIPLMRNVERIDVDVLEQEIHLHRRLQSDSVRTNITNTDKLEQKEFHQRGLSIRKEIKAAIQLTKTAASGSIPSVDQIRMSRTEVYLSIIDRQQASFQKHAESIQKSHGTMPAAVTRLQYKQLVDEEELFDKTISSLREELGKFTAESAERSEEHEGVVIVLNIITSISAGLIALLAAYLISRRILKPIFNLKRGTEEIRSGNLETSIPILGNDELSDLADSFNHMVGELRKKERIQKTFGQYVDPRIVSSLVDEDGIPLPVGEKRVMSVFFSDLAGFTSISENLAPETLVRLINGYLSEMTNSIRATDGVIDKYVGDAIMAFWGPPFNDENSHAALACETALAQIKALEKFNAGVPALLGLAKSDIKLQVRVGINTGDTIAGNVGPEAARNFTVMGDSVNLASRLEGINKQYGTSIIISENTAQLAGKAFTTRELDQIRVKGKKDPVRVYELMGSTSELKAEVLEFRNQYESALKLFRARDWAAAEQAFTKVLAQNPDDRAAKVFRGRIRHFQENPPPEDWDGVWQFNAK